MRKNILKCLSRVKKDTMMVRNLKFSDNYFLTSGSGTLTSQRTEKTSAGSNTGDLSGGTHH